MSATTRSIGYNWTLKMWTVNPTCTACSTDTDAVRFTVGTCTVIGGCDNIDLGGTREMIDVSSFEDSITKNVPGRLTLDAINIAGNFDGTCSTQKTLQGDIFHEGVVASAATVRCFSATDAVLKRRFSWKGYVNSFKVSSGVKSKASFTATILPISKIQVCTTA
jgi:hypothetical protein